MNPTPSKAATWMNCGHALTLPNVKYQSSPEALAGVELHARVAQRIAGGSPLNALGLREEALIDACASEVEGLRGFGLREEHAEEAFSVPWSPMLAMRPDWVGVSSDGHVACILDFKLGRSPVSAAGNEQLLTTAAALSVNPRFTGVLEWDLRIIAPNCYLEDARSSRVVLTQEEVTQHLKRVYDRLGDKTAHQGPWCSRCDCRMSCLPFRETFWQHHAGMEGGRPLEIPVDALAAEYRMALQVLEHAKSLVAGLELEFERHPHVPGIHRAMALKNRRFLDPPLVIETMTEIGVDPFGEPPLLSPAQMEARLKAAGVDPKCIAGLTVRDPGEGKWVLEDE